MLKAAGDQQQVSRPKFQELFVTGSLVLTVANMSRRVKDAMSFRFFVRRQQVLQLYRTFLRASRRVADPELKKELSAQIKHEFRNNVGITDASVVKSLIVEATRNLERLQAMAMKTDSDVMVQHQNNSVTTDEDDERGRVGKGWPWQR